MNVTRQRPSPLRIRRVLRGERLLDVANATRIPTVYLSEVERGDRPLAGRLLNVLALHYRTPREQLVAEMGRWARRQSSTPPGNLGGGSEARP